MALISGANRGLGREAARRLAGEGVFVYLGARDLAAGERAAREISGEGGSVEAVQLDVSDSDSIIRAVKWIDAAGRGLDVLVNNAGRTMEIPAAEITSKIMEPVFATNLFGSVDLIHACLPLLAQSAAPRIVNVASTTASLTMTASGHDFGGDGSLRLAYSSSKAALNMATIHFAAAFEADPALAHVKINSVTPGYVNTDMTGGRAAARWKRASR
ncbi:SDR family NAD(P)-dependent oxidoreductase [Amycolatopsis jiangsuensis]|uniref:NAD(P)-dependent dehydrogenase (Short-subunit alcohol dehydrogenase family) n=1 Tax=Amycolatopsis jiangsuensis TaxID=1181879 RepID=A0A840J866_9PSEU|nr:SDR family NAD(P)-dependent oxidoreductase [Amycolatopsis jiangsuensis]MBB4689578.1 NAD(P)-dependent dehydrogenase (short-subunit alcohol dehydrogenase family) [Amycolatopsis jiangsuensis]